jgi:DegV family protein with EDD domain
MRVVANPSCNLSDSAIRRYGVELTPQHVIIDGEALDTRGTTTFTEVDRWVRESRDFPHMVGTTAHEFVGVFRRLLRDDPQIVAIMTSKQVIQSYAAAVSAARVVEDAFVSKGVRIGVVDSMMTDAGAGLLAIAAGEAALAGLDVKRAMAMLEPLATSARFVFIVQTTEYLVKGGRASWLKGWLANMLDVKPMIAFVDGELKSAGRIAGRADPVEALVADACAKFAGRPLWISVFHGGVPAQADVLAARLSQRLDVRYVYKRALSPGVYIYAGPGMLGYAAVPIHGLSWTPPTPPDLSA